MPFPPPPSAAGAASRAGRSLATFVAMVCASEFATAQAPSGAERRDQQEVGALEPEHARVAAQLDALFARWRDPRPVSAAELLPFLEPDFACTPLGPEDMQPADSGKAFHVLRFEGEADAPTPTLHGPTGLAETLRAWRAEYADAASLRTKTKVDRIRVDGGDLVTRVQVRVLGHPPAGLLQWTATWQCRWSRPDADGPPRLRSIVREEATRALRAGDGESLFVDATRALFADPALLNEQFVPGLGEWQGRLPAGLGFSHLSHQGVSVGDVNGDGLEDVFLPQPGGLPNRLLLRRADGRVEDVSARAGVDFLDASRCGLLLDLDGDGDLDLVVNLVSELVFLENDGDARFRVATTGHVPETTMLAAADYDGDGDLDVYCCRYLDPYGGELFPVPYHDADNGLANVLLRNDGEWRFTDVTEEAGLDENNRRFSFAAAWEDYDGDGDQDLYVSNDFGRNNLYRNEGGRFRDVAVDAGVEDVSAGMGVSWADADGDGWMDLYVSNMQSGAGGRITGRPDYRADADDATRSALRRHARGNSLFRNRGDGTFADVSVDAGVHRGLWAWGARFADLDNDGRPDLVVPNGFLTQERPDDL